MNVEVADTFETLETSYQTTRCYIPEDSQIHDYGDQDSFRQQMHSFIKHIKC